MNIQLYITIISTVLFFVSEILPFIKTISGNSMLEIIFNCIKRIQFTKLQELNVETTTEESDPLITSDIKRLNKLIEKLLERLDENDYMDKSFYISSIDGQHLELV